MATLADLWGKGNKFALSSHLLSEEAFQQATDGIGSLMKTVCSELRVSNRELAGLPPTTKLGPRAEREFGEWKDWLDTQNPAFAEG